MLGIFTHVHSLNSLKIMVVRYHLVFVLPGLHNKTLQLKEVKSAQLGAIWEERGDPQVQQHETLQMAYEEEQGHVKKGMSVHAEVTQSGGLTIQTASPCLSPSASCRTGSLSEKNVFKRIKMIACLLLKCLKFFLNYSLQSMLSCISFRCTA